jgi:hypothetical protein
MGALEQPFPEHALTSRKSSPRSPGRVVEAEYEWPFQSHASMGPVCAVADPRADGATLWTGSQKPHFARDPLTVSGHECRDFGLDRLRRFWLSDVAPASPIRPLTIGCRFQCWHRNRNLSSLSDFSLPDA